MKILLRAGKRPEDVLLPEAAFQRNRSGVFGNNTGNLLFSNAVYRTLNVPGSTVVTDGMMPEKSSFRQADVDRINAEFDHFAIPLANAFRPSFVGHLERLSSVIERLEIPVSVIGVGAQLPRSAGDRVEDLPEELTAPVTRFMRAVLARSPKVGVRGEFTRSFLERLGFGAEHVEVIGCPSLFEEAEYRIEKRLDRLDASSKLAFNAVPDLHRMGRVLVQHLERFPDLHYVQQEYREIALLMWGEPVTGGLAQEFPRTTRHPLYQTDVARAFLDPAPWRAFLAERDFSFGNRIHGNIAALTAGTPAVVLSHDSRTLELSEYHRIPVRKLPKNPADMRAEELYEWADYTEFHAVQRENLARYTGFLEAHGLAHIHQEGQANPEYQSHLESLDYGEGLRSLAVGDRDQIISRLHWLWQGVDTDQHRLQGIYTPEFAPLRDHSRWKPVPKVLHKHLENSAARRKAQSSEQDEVARLRESVAALEEQVAELQRFATRRFAWVPENSVLRRAARKLRGGPARE